MAQDVQWTSPAPLWPDWVADPDPERGAHIRRPAILRFASDEFMQELNTVLAEDPRRLAWLVAKPETWRGPLKTEGLDELLMPAETTSLLARRLARAKRARGAAARPEAEPPEAPPFKLYQPAHQRYYLIGASLVCAAPGMPDRTIDPGAQERATFVVRRLIPEDPDSTRACQPADCAEYALLNGPGGPGWQQVAGPGGDGRCLLPGEEQLPLFPLNFTDSAGRRRRLLAGLVPVGRREAYQAAKPAVLPPAGQNGNGTAPTEVEPVDPRVILFRTQVTEPWKRLVERAFKAREVRDTVVPDVSVTAQQKAELVKSARDLIQTVSWYVLLDFLKYLEQYLEPVYLVVTNKNPESSLVGPQKTLYNQLKLIKIPDPDPNQNPDENSLVWQLTKVGSNSSGYVESDVKRTLLSALQAIGAEEADLESVVSEYREGNIKDPNWPAFLFPLADPLHINPNLSTPQAPIPPKPAGFDTSGEPIDIYRRRVDALNELVRAALPLATPEPMPARALAAQQPADARDGWYVIRCVFEQPNCGPLHPPLVSAATRPFQMAGFFDPDAPARPIRINLPVDVSPAGLRKFDRNTAFMVSDMLCGQVQRAQGMSLADLIMSVLPWPLHKDLSIGQGPCKDTDSFGMILSLSIPIITICALILLIIIVSLLDMIFRWLPFFIIWFPIPKFKAKR